MAAKYIEEVKYLLRMDGEDKRAYEASAQADRLSLADWINRVLRKEIKRKRHNNATRPKLGDGK